MGSRGVGGNMGNFIGRRVKTRQGVKEMKLDTQGRAKGSLRH